MFTYNFVNQAGVSRQLITPATTKDASLRRVGDSISTCCGSQYVSDLSIDGLNKGITFSFNDKPSDLESTEHFVVESTELEPGLFLNLKLRIKHD